MFLVVWEVGSKLNGFNKVLLNKWGFFYIMEYSIFVKENKLMCEMFGICLKSKVWNIVYIVYIYFG